MIGRLDEIIRGNEFREQMSRFIPSDIQERTLKKEKFFDFLVNETTALLTDAKSVISGDGLDDKFII